MDIYIIETAMIYVVGHRSTTTSLFPVRLYFDFILHIVGQRVMPGDERVVI